MSERKMKTIAVLITLITILVIGTISYAFFITSVDNTNKETVTAGSAKISLVFDDNDNGISATLNPGESITKKFTLENTGTVDALCKLSWKELYNTYSASSLFYTLEQSTSENGTYEYVDTGYVPRTTSAINGTLKEVISIPKNQTYYYKLTIHFLNTSYNQNSDINATMNSKFSVDSSAKMTTAVETIENMVAGYPKNSINVITLDSTQSCTNTFAYDRTTDNNLRYVGANPCNYVSIQDVNGKSSLWRMIGVMNNVDDGTGKQETRIKITKFTDYHGGSWDSSSSSINSGLGINDWTQADAMTELNGDYLNPNLQENTTWYSGQNNMKTSSFPRSRALSYYVQKFIGDAKWKLGGISTLSYTAQGFYNYERNVTRWGNFSGTTCNDGACPRATEWTGKIALLYPSDYAYAVGGSVRSTCLTSAANNYNSDCKNQLWIRFQTWFLSPAAGSPSEAIGFTGGDNQISSISTSSVLALSSTAYLKSDVYIKSGMGSQNNPFVLKLND